MRAKNGLIMNIGETIKIRFTSSTWMDICKCRLRKEMSLYLQDRTRTLAWLIARFSHKTRMMKQICASLPAISLIKMLTILTRRPRGKGNIILKPQPNLGKDKYQRISFKLVTVWAIAFASKVIWSIQVIIMMQKEKVGMLQMISDMTLGEREAVSIIIMKTKLIRGRIVRIAAKKGSNSSSYRIY